MTNVVNITERESNTNNSRCVIAVKHSRDG